MHRVIAIAALVVVALGVGLWTMRSRIEPAQQVSPGEAGVPGQPAVASPPQTPDDRDTEEEPPAQIPELPRPSAPWLAAPANPLTVTLTLSDREQQQRITPAGGTLTASTSDGTRISLSFPPGALWRSEEITIRAVEAVGGAPFAASPIAVNITPEDLPLRRSPVLQFEPGRRSTFDAAGGIAGFAVRRGSELSLYPVAREEIERAPGRYRMTMALTRLGTYGVTGAVAAEVAVVGGREPSDLAARMEGRIALGYAAPAPGSDPATTIASWSLIPRVHAQGGVSLFIYDLLKKLLEYYEQVVVPKFDKLPTRDCRSGATFEAISTYLQWRAGVELLLPMQAPDEGPLDEVFLRLVAQRVTMLRERGYTSEQIDEIDRTIEQFREQFGRMTSAIDARIRPALTAQFSTLYRCCTTQRPMLYHLEAMKRVLRFADLNGYAPVDPDPMPKLFECACIVGANQPGAPERFIGTMSYEESTSLNRTQQTGNRTGVNSETLTFSQSSLLTFARGDATEVESTVTGARAKSVAVVDDHGTCVVRSESAFDVEGRDHHTGLASINVNVQQGTYTLSPVPAPLEGAGSRQTIWNVSGPACGKFNKPRDENRWTKEGIVPVRMRTVSGKLDVNQPTVLKGSEVFEEEDRFYGTTRRATLKWDLQRCKR